MAFKHLFLLEDKIMRLPGLYLMWTILYISNLTALLVDDTQGPSRDFNVWVNALSVIYGGFSSLNNIYGNKLPSTMLLSAGPIHQYTHWLLFGYYGGSKVLGSHPVGVMNWISLIVIGIFTVDMVIKTWICSFRPEWYNQYVAEQNIEVVPREVEVTATNNNINDSA